MKKLLIALCVLSMGLSAHAQTAKKKVKKTVVTEETDSNGKTIKRTETTETEGEGETEKPQAKEYDANAIVVPEGLKTINEDWYTLWGLGFSKGKFSGDLGNAFEDFDGQAGVDREAGFTFDILGFYWPLEDHKTMMGVIMNGSVDTLKDSASDEMSIDTYLLAFSMQHFFGANIGDGWFLRGDVGLAKAAVEFKLSGTTYSKSSDTGFGALFGAGYGFPLGKQTRLLLGLNYRLIPELKITGITYNSNEVTKLKGSVTSLTVGVLF